MLLSQLLIELVFGLKIIRKIKVCLTSHKNKDVDVRLLLVDKQVVLQLCYLVLQLPLEAHFHHCDEENTNPVSHYYDLRSHFNDLDSHYYDLVSHYYEILTATTDCYSDRSRAGKPCLRDSGQASRLSC